MNSEPLSEWTAVIGPKTNTQGAVLEAKSRLRMQELVGVPNKGKEGLGIKSDERRDIMIIKALRVELFETI